MYENLRLSRSWDPCTEIQVARFEVDLAFDLPLDYRAFLLEQNGGLVEPPRKFPLKREGGGPMEAVERFYGLGSRTWADLEVACHSFHRVERRMPDYLLPIAKTEFGDQICLLLNNKTFGWILFWDHERDVDFSDPQAAREPLRNCSLLAKSFQGFLESLLP